MEGEGCGEDKGQRFGVRVDDYGGRLTTTRTTKDNKGMEGEGGGEDKGQLFIRVADAGDACHKKIRVIRVIRA